MCGGCGTKSGEGSISAPQERCWRRSRCADRECNGAVAAVFAAHLQEEAVVTHGYRIWIQWLCIAVPVLLGACASAPPSLERREVSAEAPRAAPTTWRRAGVLGAGDQIDIFVWGYPDYTRRATVAVNGSLPHPVIGELPVAGKTTAEVEQQVRAALTDFIRDPIIRVTVATGRPQRIQVLGEVGKPGVYPLASADTSLIEGLALAGGLTPDGRANSVLVVRDLGKQVEVHTLDFDRITRTGDVLSNIALQDGDIVFVPPTRVANVAREAARISQIIGTVLLFQNITVLWEPFKNALLHGSTTPGNPIVVPN